VLILHDNTNTKKTIGGVWSQTNKITYQGNLISGTCFVGFFTFSLIDIISQKQFLFTHFHSCIIALSVSICFFSFLMLIFNCYQFKKNWSRFYPSEGMLSTLSKTIGFLFVIITCAQMSTSFNASSSFNTFVILIAICTFWFILSEKLSPKKENYFGITQFPKLCYYLEMLFIAGIAISVFAIGNAAYMAQGYSPFHMPNLATIIMISIGIISAIGKTLLNDCNAQWDNKVEYIPRWHWLCPFKQAQLIPSTDSANKKVQTIK
jgi:hypothetical protein